MSPATDAAPLHAALLAWYARHGRDLPWRHSRDPYAILVAEIMLQQTQVERVIPKYHAFLAEFPAFADLADAPTEAVIRAWASLGYNQRAVRLQGVARTIMRDHGGQMPATLAGLLALPGIGRYTAGAIACFALGQAVATVDTNIRRVLVRILIGDLSPDATAYDKPDMALRLAEAALPPEPERAYAWNQALMDIGATICLARAPACDRCPLAEQCRTYGQLRERTLFPSGAELAALRVAETQATYATTPKPSAPFKTTNRYFRGRVVAALSALPPNATLALADLGPQIKPDFSATDEPWLQTLVTRLVRDGLAAWADDAHTRLILPR
jgi:A/G-specific adenine glycosylase